MTRLEILQRLLDLRNDGIQKEERILLVDQEIEMEDSAWDPEEIKEIDLEF